MTRGNKTGHGYFDKKFHDEALDCHIGMSPGAVKAGFTDLRNVDQFTALVNKLDPKTGLPMGRVQYNRDTKVFGMVIIPDNSITNWYAGLYAKEAKKFWTEAWGPAAQKGYHFLDQMVPLRSGAGGSVLLKGEIIWGDFGHHHTRNKDPFVHGQPFSPMYGVASDGKLYKVHEKRLRANKDGFDQVFAFNLAANIEKVFGHKCGVDVATNTTFIHGYSRTFDRKSTNDKAKEYLAQHNYPVTRTTMEIARKEIRPKKEPYQQVKRPMSQEAKGQPEPSQNQGRFWRELYEDFIKGPAKVYKAACRASRKSPDRHIVDNVPEFIAEAKKPSLWDRHKAAARAIRKTRCKSFLHALDVAKAANLMARTPKLVLPKGTEIKVKWSLIKSDEQFQRLREVCAVHGYTLNAYGQQTQQQKDQQQQQQKGRTL